MSREYTSVFAKLNRSFSADKPIFGMRIPRIDEALDKCEAHLSLEKAVEPEVQSLLTQSLLILICAEFEKKVLELIEERCQSVSDDSVRAFLKDCTKSVFRSLRISEIAGLLNRFGTSHKEAFNQHLENNEKVKSRYDSILSNRNQVAHGGGSNATLREVKEYYEEGHLVLDYLRDALFQNVDGTA